MLGKLFGMQRGNSMQKFRRTYNATDFGLTADVTCQPSMWSVIGSVTVPAQQQVTFGSTDPNGTSVASGSACYLRIDSTGGQLQGKIRFALTNANETNTIVVLEETTQRLSASVYDRTQAVLLPEYPTKAKEDSKLQVLFYPADSSAVTIDYDGADTQFSIPVTVYQ